jgi:glucose-6-phosphate 1-epimerase
MTNATTIDQLNTDFGIADQLTFTEGKGGFPIIAIKNDHATAQISVYGGQVLSFQPVSQKQDLLFLSATAYYQEGKAIKGGVPICWPWFGPDPEGLERPNHGFVRNRLWSVLATDTTALGETLVTLGVSSTDETRELWPYDFDLRIEISVGPTLAIALMTINRSNQPMAITQALHTYFTIGEVNQVTISGLENTRYIDKVDGGAEKTQSGAVAIGQEVDRIYKDVPSELVIDDPVLDRKIHIASTGSKSAVVWNPWVDISVKSGDLEDDAYTRFICVETTNAADDVVTIAPGSEFRLTATYSAS